MVSRRCSVFVTIVEALVLQSDSSLSPDPEKLKGERSPSVVTSPSSRFLLKSFLYRRLGPRVVLRIAHRVTRKATNRTAVSPIFEPARQLQRSCGKQLTATYAIRMNTVHSTAKKKKTVVGAAAAVLKCCCKNKIARAPTYVNWWEGLLCANVHPLPHGPGSRWPAKRTPTPTQHATHPSTHTHTPKHNCWNCNNNL